MESYGPPFDWRQFPEGRARFSGGVRGIMDEQRHEAFAVDVGGVEYFGEIQRTFLPNNNDYNLEVVAFGYGSEREVGIPTPGTRRIFTAAEARTVRTLVTRLVATGSKHSNKPTLLNQYPNARFMGKIGFRDGWARVKDDEAAS